jgi:hypothetical protein
MTWICPSCGVENASSARACAICLRPQKEVTVVLTSTATGQALVVRIPTVFGRRLLGRFAGDDARFASEAQFELIRDELTADWLVRHHEDARHPTFYDGAALGPIPVPLGDGGTLSIGPARLCITVRLESSTGTSRP